MMDKNEFKQFCESGLSYKQFLTFEKPKVSQDGKFSATILQMGEFNAKGNMFIKGAFDEFVASNPKIPMYFQHNQSDYIGIWDNFRIEDNLLVADAKLFSDITQQSKETLSLLQAGYINRVSAGGASAPEDVMVVDRVDSEGKFRYGFVIKKSKLFEASLVLNPGDEEAKIRQDLSVDIQYSGKTVSDIVALLSAEKPKEEKQIKQEKVDDKGETENIVMEDFSFLAKVDDSMFKNL